MRGWKLASAALLCWALAASMLACYYYVQYTTISQAYSRLLVHVDLYIDYGNGTVEHHELALANATAFNALLEAKARVEYEVYPGMGILVVAINGVRNNETLVDHWWLYYVNGVLAPVACDRYYLSNGDVVCWNYTKMPW